MKYKSTLKAIIVVLLSYSLLYSEIFGEITFFLKVGFAVLDCFFILSLLNKTNFQKKLRIPKAIFLLLIFFVTTLAFGFLVTERRDYFLEHILIGIQYFILFVTVYQISSDDGNMKFIAKVLFLISIAYILISLSRGVTIYERLVIGDDSNANTLGNMCFWCMGLGVYLSRFQKNKWLLPIVCLVITVYATILSGSRKYLICILAFVVAYYLLLFRTVISKNILKALVGVLAVAVIIAIGFPYMKGIFDSSIISQRFEESSIIDRDRVILYQDAINVFKKHWVFGVGYQCFGFYSSIGLYSHSAYAELLSCTGIIGFGLWILAYWDMLKKAIQGIWGNSRNENYIFPLIWIISQIALDFVSVSLYSPGAMAILGGVFALLVTNIDVKNKIKGSEKNVISVVA